MKKRPKPKMWIRYAIMIDRNREFLSYFARTHPDWIVYPFTTAPVVPVDDMPSNVLLPVSVNGQREKNKIIDFLVGQYNKAMEEAQDIVLAPGWDDRRA